MRFNLGDFYVELDGLLVHGLVGFIAVILNLAIPLTVIYVVYQLIDYLDGEDPREMQGDLVEYAVGLVAGKLLTLLALIV